jgi:hypothetical protein
MAWDSTDGEIILVGGWSNNSFSLTDTFKFSGTTGSQGKWANITSTAGLFTQGRQFGQLADDPSDGGMVLFGGEAFAADLSDTWLFKSGTWHLQTLTTHPNAREEGGFVWDTADSVALLVGGTNFEGTYNYTWGWASGKWTDLTNTSGIPFSAGTYFGFTFDAADNYVLAYGGLGTGTGASPYSQQTWGYVNHAWTPIKQPTISVTGPPARIYAAMAFDAKDGWVFLFGGSSASGTLLNDMWSWSPASRWQEVCASCTPSAREGAGFVWANATYTGADPLYLFGGSTSSGDSNSLYSFTITSATSGTWTSLSPSGAAPSVREFFGMDWDPAQGLLVVVDGMSSGIVQNNVHTYSPLLNAWNAPVPSGAGPTIGLFDIEFAWDGAASLFYGGNDGSQSYTGLYTLTFTTASIGKWTTYTPLVGTTARSGAVFTYDSQFADMVMYGTSQADPYPTATWDYNTTLNKWEDRTNSSGTRPDNGDSGPAGTFDSTAGYTVVTGSGEAAFPDWTWIYGPPLSQGLTLPTSADSGNIFAGTISAYGGSGGNVYSWHGLPSFCTFSGGPTSVSCNPGVISNTTYPIRTDVLDIVGDVASETTYLTVHPDPTISTPTITPGYNVESGSLITISAIPSGGDGTYTFSWTGLPSGCASTILRVITCSVSVASNTTYSAIKVTVTDSIGTAITSSAAPTLTIYAPFTPNAITVTPPSGLVDSGQAASFAVSANGGSGGYTFVWTGLPTGCTSANSRTISCNPTAAATNQTYASVQAQMTDSASKTIFSPTASLTVDVDPTVTAPTVTPGYNVASGTPITISATPSGGNGVYTFLWSGLPTGCSSANARILSCAVSASSNTTYSSIRVTVSDGLGSSDQSSAAPSLTVFGPLAVSTVSVTPIGGVVDSGQAATFTVTASGGAGGYTFSWTGLPIGCSSSNSVMISCNPTASGTNQSYASIQAHVTDSSSSTIVSAVASLTVNTDPIVSTPTIAPGYVVVTGTPITITSIPAGGNGAYTFSWSGLPAGCSTSNAPTLSCIVGVTTNTTYTVIKVKLTDGLGSSNVSNPASPFTVTTSTPVPLKVSAITVTPAGGVIDSGQAASFKVNASGGIGVYSYSWTGLPSGCTSSNSTTIACDPISSVSNQSFASIQAHVTDSSFTSVVSSAASLKVDIDPAMATPTIAPSYSVATGTPITIAGIPSGGNGVYTFSWSGLPAGCTSSNARILSCTVSVTTNTTYPAIKVKLTDGMGSSNTSAASLPLTVTTSTNMPLRVSVITVAPARGVIDSGQAASFTVTASGGSGVYTYSWTGLPNGCSSSNSAAIACNPTASGLSQSYTSIQAHVTDSSSTSVVSASASITVNLDPSVRTSPSGELGFDLGASVLISANAGNGTPGFAYTWYRNGVSAQVGPNGSYLFSPTTNGSYVLWVSVNDSLGYYFASAHLNVTVKTSGGNGGGSSASGFNMMWLLLAIVILVAIVIVVVAVVARRRKKPAAQGMPAYRQGGPYAQAPQAAWAPPAPQVAPGPAPTAPFPPPTASVPPPVAPVPVPATEVSPPAVPVAAPVISPPEVVPQWPFQPLTVLETTDEKNVWKVVGKSGLQRDGLLCFTREAPSLLTGEFGLQGATIYRLSRVEGENTVGPGELEKIIDIIERHLAKGSGRAVVLPSLEGLVEATSVKSVGRLLEVARDLAQTSRSAVLVSFDPKTLPENQAALLRRGAVRLAISEQ